MDLDTVARIHRSHKFNLTWRGNSEVKEFCVDKLLQFFDSSTITWERDGHQVPSPLHIKLRLQFVPFNLDAVANCFNFDLERSAVLHLFFIKPTTVDEYRNKYRNDIIEWSAALSRLDSDQWMIVFDSTKARERRNRGAVMEKIKSDFTKSMNKVIEIDENAADSMGSLYLASKVHMLAFLDKVIATEEQRLSVRKEDYYMTDFDYISFSNAQMRLIQLYHSLHVLERVLAKLDELDGLLSLIVSYFLEQAVRPKWVSAGSAAVSECCPLLSVMSYQKQMKYRFLIDVRTFIAAQNIVISLLLYKERLLSEKVSSGLLQSKADFAAIVLRHAYHCITVTFENIAALELLVDNNRLQCWTASLCLETLQIVEMVVGNTLPKSLSHFACSLSVLKCKAIKSLIISKERLTDVFSWFDSATQVAEIKSDAVLRFRNCFTDEDSVHKLIQECFEASSMLLEHYGWERQRSILDFEHASLLLALNRSKLAIPYLIKVIFLLIRDGSSLLPDLLPTVVRNLEEHSESYTEELLNFYVVLTLCGRTSEERMHCCQKFLNNLPNFMQNKGKQMYYPKTWKHYMPLHISCSGSSIQPVYIGTPGDSLHMPLSIVNGFPVSLPSCKICCIYKKVPNVEAFEKIKIKSHYKCTYSAMEHISRFGCVVHRYDGPESETSNDTEDENIIVFEPRANASCDLSSGITMLELIAEITGLCCGIFILDHVEIAIFNSMVLSFSWSDFLMDSCVQRPICFVYKQMPSVYLKTPPGSLYAGVWQQLEFELSFGSEPDSSAESVLELQTSRYEDSVQFWCPTVSNWSNKGLFHIKRNSTGLPIIVCVYVYCSMNRLMKYCSGEDAAIFSKQLSVRWQGFQWNFTVTFTPLVRVKTAVSLLEEKLLVELQFIREDESTWIILPDSAVLVSSTSETEVPAKLFNYKLTAILPCSSYRIVWLLNDDNALKNAVEEFKLEFGYRIKSKKPVADDVPEAVRNRTYEYEDVLAIPNGKASYELFAQILPAQPGAVLCRVNIPCDLIVSLRSLSSRVETVIISICAEEAYWSVSEKHKFLYVKESGLGQTSFAITPKITGFLPYPSVTVHRCQHKRTSSDKSTQSHCEESDFGAVVPSFVRSGGKQVHVLGLQHSGAVDQKYSGEKSKRLKEAKNRLAKFFD